jgi:hypothetical protein
VKSIENGEALGFTPLCFHGIPDDIENAAVIGRMAVQFGIIDANVNKLKMPNGVQ